jgi:Tfp pilus assembly ATPase PilU
MKFGMVTLDACLIEKYEQGLISREDVINKSQDATTIMAKLQEMDLASAVEKKGGKK